MMAVEMMWVVLTGKPHWEAVRITAAEAVRDVQPGWTPDRYNTFGGRNRRK